jgi:hypothetical protein
VGGVSAGYVLGYVIGTALAIVVVIWWSNHG